MVFFFVCVSVSFCLHVFASVCCSDFQIHATCHQAHFSPSLNVNAKQRACNFLINKQINKYIFRARFRATSFLFR